MSEDGPEMTRLLDRLFNRPGVTLRHIHVDWGPEAYKLSPEELAAHINKALDAPVIEIDPDDDQ